MGDLVKAAATSFDRGRLCTIWPYDRLDEWQSWAEGAGFHEAGACSHASPPAKAVHCPNGENDHPKRQLPWRR